MGLYLMVHIGQFEFRPGNGLCPAACPLEAAIASTGKDAAPSNGMPDSAMIISEIGRIDAQLAQAMELLADIRRGAASEGGNA